MEAVKEAIRLQRVWVGSGSPDFDRIRKSATQELRFSKTKQGREGVVREIQHDLSILGKVKAAYKRAEFK